MATTLDVLAGTTNTRVVTEPKPTDPVTVIPYNANDDRESAALLPWLWAKLQADDLVDYYFPGQEQTGFASFVRLMSGEGGTRAALLGIPATSRNPEDSIIGLITWSPTVMGASPITIIGCLFFRKFWDRKITDEAAKAALSFWFNQTDTQVLVGVCPSLHRAIALYNRRIGLVETGRIPMAHIYKGTPCDAVLYALTRQQWEGR